MKTNEFIKLLQQEDPNNECDVCVGNHPVNNIEKIPYYYDGRQEFIEYDDTGYPIKGGFPLGTMKLKIHYDTLENALMENPDMVLDLSGITYQGKVDANYQKSIDEFIQQGRQLQTWRAEYAEARKNGKKLPPISKPLTFKDKLVNWLANL